MHEVRKGFTFPTDFSKKMTWNIIIQRCTKVIKHCACAVKWASLRRNSFRSGQTLSPARNFTWLWKINILMGKSHYKLPFSIAMLNYRRVCCCLVPVLCNLLHRHYTFQVMIKEAWLPWDQPTLEAIRGLQQDWRSTHPKIQHLWEPHKFPQWIINSSSRTFLGDRVYRHVTSNYGGETPQIKLRGSAVYSSGKNPWFPAVLSDKSLHIVAHAVPTTGEEQRT